MVCPMKDTTKPLEVGSEYPYESLYRPWSWILSSTFNIFLFAVVMGILYVYCKTRKRAKRSSVTYRTAVQVAASSSKKADAVVAVVTGGNGALGRELVKKLLEDGAYAVHSLDILLPEEEDRMEGVCSYIQADITNCDDLCIAFRGVAAVFHCASLTPLSVRHSDDDYHQVNVKGTESVIEACLGCGVERLVYTSTASVTLSRSTKLESKDADEAFPLPEDPLNVYVATKGKADRLVRQANGKEGGRLATCVLRPNVFVHSIFNAVEEISLFPNMGDVEVSVVPVESVAQAHVLAEKKLCDGQSSAVVSGKAYNICDQKLVLHEFAKFVASEKKTSVTFLPFSLVYLVAWINEVIYRWVGMVAVSETLSTISMNYKTHTYVSDLARRELGWGPSTPWRDVVKGMLEKRQQGSKKEN